MAKNKSRTIISALDRLTATDDIEREIQKIHHELLTINRDQHKNQINERRERTHKLITVGAVASKLFETNDADLLTYLIKKLINGDDQFWHDWLASERAAYERERGGNQQPN